MTIQANIINLSQLSEHDRINLTINTLEAASQIADTIPGKTALMVSAATLLIIIVASDTKHEVQDEFVEYLQAFMEKHYPAGGKEIPIV